MNAAALVFQLYTEDRADGVKGCPTLREVTLGVLVHLRPDLKTNHVELRPLHERPERRVSGSFWKSGPAAEVGAQSKRRMLIEDIVTALRRGHLVVFHVDGDDQWLVDGRHAEVWRHLERLQRDVETLARDATRGRSPLPAAVRLEHVFIPAVPFYSIESWAYANSAYLREILTTSSDLAFVARWEADPGRRDDVLKIKDETLSIRDSLNEELVKRSRGFPCAALAAVGKSYTATIRRFATSPRVMEGLAEAASRPW